ncbi:MAG: hypothetical protein IIT55_08605, partial [Bacteroidaceae bacterium]|nr:hypothetical protein [Bacteroidaceae bacterium]
MPIDSVIKVTSFSSPRGGREGAYSLIYHMDFIIADNQEITRFAVEHLLDGFPGKRILHASKKTELIEQLKEHEQSVVIIDYTLFDFFDAQNL